MSKVTELAPSGPAEPSSDGSRAPRSANLLGGLPAGKEHGAPGAVGRGVGAQEVEARIGGVIAIGVGVTDVVVRLCQEPRPDVGQTVLEHREVGGDAEPLPDLLLVANRPVRAGADEIAEPLGRAHEGDADDPGRLADLQGAVDVEADEYRGRPRRPLHPRGPWLSGTPAGCPRADPTGTRTLRGGSVPVCRGLPGRARSFANSR